MVSIIDNVKAIVLFLNDSSHPDIQSSLSQQILYLIQKFIIWHLTLFAFFFLFFFTFFNQNWLAHVQFDFYLFKNNIFITKCFYFLFSSGMKNSLIIRFHGEFEKGIRWLSCLYLTMLSFANWRCPDHF